MWDAAVAATRAVGYEGVGTVEFVVSDDECAFLEMNTRLQVEHGVTELVTGVDLVGLQLIVAAGRPLPFTQDDVAVTGHSVEVRLCAEVPRYDYRPAPGRVVHARWPDGDGVRVDAAVESGGAVSPAYDNLVAKVLAWGDDRATAVGRLRTAVRGGLELDGIETNRDLLAAALGDADFVAGRTSTDYLDRHADVVAAAVDPVVQRHHAGRGRSLPRPPPGRPIARPRGPARLAQRRPCPPPGPFRRRRFEPVRWWAVGVGQPAARPPRRARRRTRRPGRAARPRHLGRRRGHRSDDRHRRSGRRRRRRPASSPRPRPDDRGELRPTVSRH